MDGRSEGITGGLPQATPEGLPWLLNQLNNQRETTSMELTIGRTFVLEIRHFVYLRVGKWDWYMGRE